MAYLEKFSKILWDYIIIGSGMGGSTIGYELSRRGHTVLICEKGKSYKNWNKQNQGLFAEEKLYPFLHKTESDLHLKNFSRFNQPLTNNLKKNRNKIFPILGAGAGGSSSIYGAVLERFYPIDFNGIDSIADANKQNKILPSQWPINFEDLTQYYNIIEKLMYVNGQSDPLKKFEIDISTNYPPLHPVNRKLYYDFIEYGLHPYRIPQALKRNNNCKMCQGFLCESDCKRNSVNTFLIPSIENFGLITIFDCEVKYISSEKTKVTGITIDCQNNIANLQAKNIIISAGAFETPKLLLNSKSLYWPNGIGNQNDMVGRGLMKHVFDLYCLKLDSKLGRTNEIKEIGFNDYYIHNGIKLGNVQSFGCLPNPKALVNSIIYKSKLNSGILNNFGKSNNYILEPILNFIFNRSSMLVSTLEDFPYKDNRVTIDKYGSIHISYKLNTSEINRLKIFRKLLSKLFKNYSPLRIQPPHLEMLGHSCGTCRMGNDQKTSVVDKNCKVHELENLFIVDSSIFPSSGGINPALTIAANAMRIAFEISKRSP